MIGYIYKIVKEGDDHIYIGSTNESLKERLRLHKKNAIKSPNRKVYKYILENGGWDRFKIKKVEKIEYANDSQLKQREEYYRSIQDKELLLNTYKSYTGLTEKEYRRQYQKESYQNNKEKISEKRKKYYQNNKDQIKERKKEKINCDICGLSVMKNNIQRHQRSTKCLKYKEIYDFINH